MNRPYIILLGVYVLYSLLSRRPGDESIASRFPVLGFIIQTPLFLMACYFGAQQGVFSRELVSPLGIGLGLVAGHMVFGASLLITHRVLRDAAEHFLGLASLWRFLVEVPNLLLRFLVVSFSEELLFRVAAQPILIAWTGSAAIAILIIAVAFSVVHKHFFRNSFSQSAEFFAFAILLGALYYWTNSLIVIVVVHTLRNLESLYLDYLIKVDELGDEEAAMNAIERSYLPQTSETI